MELKLGIGLHWEEGTKYPDLVSQIEEIESLGYQQV